MNNWDEKVRGVKMSNPTKNTIFKYQIPVLENFQLKLPKDAEILRVESQNGLFWLWAKVDLEAPEEERNFYSFKTGGDIPNNLNLKYLGYCTIFVQQELCLYIFESL